MSITVPSQSTVPIGVGGVIHQDQNGNAAAIITPADAQALASLIGLSAQQIALAFNGATFDLARTAKKIAPVALTAATAETTVYTPTSGKKFRILGGMLTVSAQSILTWKDNTAGSTIFVLEPAANTPLSFSFGTLGILSAAANNLITVTRATSATLNGFLLLTEE